METLDKDKGKELTKTVMQILDEWGLGSSDIIQIVGLPEKTRSRHLEHYRQDTSFPNSTTITDRISHIIGIADALRTTFPRNSRMGSVWMRTPHRRFGNRTPLATIREDKISGLISVRSELDCSYAWQRSTS